MGTNLGLWIVIGVVAGLLVYLLFDRNKKYFVGTVFSGIAGSFVGGMVYVALKIGKTAVSIEPLGLISAIFGALILLILVTVLIKGEEKSNTSPLV